MSRTLKDRATPRDRSYWSKRPGNRHGALPGKFTKIVTHRRERAQAKRELIKEATA